MFHMAHLTLIYGLRLLPEGEVTAIQDTRLKLANGHEACVTMHILEWSRNEIERQLIQSLDACFDFYPEI
jgi:N-acyl-L-homoserine lactone synthetase